MEIEIGDGYVVRPFESTDRDAIVKHADNRKVWLGLKDMFPHPYTDKDAVAWLDRVASMEADTSLAIASPEELIGGIGFTLMSDVNRRSAELGYWLGEAYWGRGIATRAVKAVTEYAFSAFDIMRLYAEVFSNNPASIRVLEKAGYVFEGRLRRHVIKDGQVLDMLVYATIR